MAQQNRNSSEDNKRFVSRLSYDGTGYSSSGYPPPIHHNNAPQRSSKLYPGLTVERRKAGLLTQRQNTRNSNSIQVMIIINYVYSLSFIANHKGRQCFHSCLSRGKQIAIQGRGSTAHPALVLPGRERGLSTLTRSPTPPSPLPWLGLPRGGGGVVSIVF